MNGDLLHDLLRHWAEADSPITSQVPLLAFLTISYAESVFNFQYFGQGLDVWLAVVFFSWGAGGDSVCVSVLSCYSEISFSFFFPVTPIVLGLKGKFNNQKDNNFTAYYFISFRTILTNSSAPSIFILYLQSTTLSFALTVVKPCHAYLTLNHFSLVHLSNSWLTFLNINELVKSFVCLWASVLPLWKLRENSDSRDQAVPSPTVTSLDRKENKIILSGLCSEHFCHFSEPNCY